MHRAQEGAVRAGRGEMGTAWHRRWERTLTVTNTEDNGNLLALDNPHTAPAVEPLCHRAFSSSCVLLKGTGEINFAIFYVIQYIQRIISTCNQY